MQEKSASRGAGRNLNGCLTLRFVDVSVMKGKNPFIQNYYTIFSSSQELMLYLCQPL